MTPLDDLPTSMIPDVLDLLRFMRKVRRPLPFTDASPSAPYLVALYDAGLVELDPIWDERGNAMIWMAEVVR